MVRSMNIDDWRPTTDLRANSHILGKLQTAITLQSIIRCPSCLVLGWGFRGWQIERRHFRLDQIQDGGRRLKSLNGYISETHYSIHFTYVHRPFAIGLYNDCRHIGTHISQEQVTIRPAL